MGQAVSSSSFARSSANACEMPMPSVRSGSVHSGLDGGAVTTCKQCLEVVSRVVVDRFD